MLVEFANGTQLQGIKRQCNVVNCEERRNLLCKSKQIRLLELHKWRLKGNT